MAVDVRERLAREAARVESGGDDRDAGEGGGCVLSVAASDRVHGKW
jgi:hypothetical protein